jgi:hypothetical protein
MINMIGIILLTVRGSGFAVCGKSNRTPHIANPILSVVVT